MIEDDILKAARIIEYISRRDAGHEIVHHRSYQSGLKSIQETVPDLIFLDMSIPTFDMGPTSREGRPRSMGGRDVMRKLVRRGINCVVVVVTQLETFGEGADAVTFEQLGQLCKTEFPDLFSGIVHYHATSSAWISELDRILEWEVGSK
ncbi:response regulator [Kaistia defluvii]|uniref:CheY-like chemotaxis protein n=1 Tax=Kaistia defluvii TaxID=410841 RepID=A0ABV2R1A4_9HYPH